MIIASTPLVLPNLFCAEAKVAVEKRITKMYRYFI
jgi:hypothetical protein